MALFPYQPGIQPLGQFDLIDQYMATIKGGECGTLFAAPKVNSASEKAAYDVLNDGYTNVVQVKRVAIAPSIADANVRPLWLLDEGKSGYGVLFGSVIGTPVGLSTTGTNLGPSTTSGSGKVTAYDKPGIFAISTDAVDTSADGLVMTNTNCVPGAKIQPQHDGVLTVSTAGTAVNVTIGRFVEFEVMPFLVTTPPSLIGATKSATRVIIAYHVE